MRVVFPIVPLAVCVLMSNVAAADGRSWMQEEEIRAELTGRRVAGIYPSRVEWAEEIRADGTTVYEEGMERRPGRWRVAGELFCFSYAISRQGGCFRIVKHSANCYELYTASIGGELPSVPPPATTMSWNGRLWRVVQPATCEEKPIS